MNVLMALIGVLVVSNGLIWGWLWLEGQRRQPPRQMEQRGGILWVDGQPTMEYTIPQPLARYMLN